MTLSSNSAHFTEAELIAYQMGESPSPLPIRHHLEECNQCSAIAETIAETLRLFSATPVPEPDLPSAWARLEARLPAPLEQPPSPSSSRSRLHRWRLWFALPAAGLAFAALLFAVFLGVRPHTPARRPALQVNGLAVREAGPLRAQPADPAVAAHLEIAERLLTEVNHQQGPLDTDTRQQAHTLLLQNANFVQTAHAHGDIAEASVLEDLGRVLTTLDHEPPTPRGTWRLRLEMNTDGLLLDIRILRQNDEHRQ